MRHQRGFTKHLAGKGPGGRSGAERRTSASGTPHLFARWSEVRKRLCRARHTALMLDFDGTIVPIQPRPEAVRLSLPTRRLIERLARHSRMIVCLISGRRLADLRRRAKLAGARYLGMYGWEEGGKAPRLLGARAIAKAKGLVTERLGSLPGIWVEGKGISFAVHYRGATVGAARRARCILRKTLEPFERRLHVVESKKVWEVLPPEVGDKGRAVRRLLAKLPRATVPIYVGDDTTDESAFAALRHGITVRVGKNRRTQARFYLRNPDEVVRFLEKLEAEVT